MDQTHCMQISESTCKIQLYNSLYKKKNKTFLNSLAKSRDEELILYMVTKLNLDFHHHLWAMLVLHLKQTNLGARWNYLNCSQDVFSPMLGFLKTIRHESQGLCPAHFTFQGRIRVFSRVIYPYHLIVILIKPWIILCNLIFTQGPILNSSSQMALSIIFVR